MNCHKHIYDETGLCFECDKKMTPAQICKTKYGMTLQEASDRTGKDRKTLYNWAKNQESFFHIVMLGCLSVRESEE